MNIYVIAAYGHAAEVRQLHARLRELGHTPTSRWAEEATGPEDLGSMALEQLADAWERNHADMLRADAVIVLADTAMREGFMEAERAVEAGMSIVWVGRPTLSVAAFPGRARMFASVDEAVEGLA